MHSLPISFDGVPSSDSAPKQNLNSEMTSENLSPVKPRYTRPEHSRVFCAQCDIHTEGFRGEHELRKRVDREHPNPVTKWVCIESTKPGHPIPVLPFSKCKACLQQKQYGPYYNAAAHLRRAHFRPKLPSQSKIGGGEAKRGGKRGVVEANGASGGGDAGSFWKETCEVYFKG